MVRRALFAILTVVLCSVAAGATQAPPVGAVVSGVVKTESGQPANGVWIAVVPVAESAWTNPQAVQRAVVANGAFTIAGVPPGDYRLAVASAAALTDWPAAAVLRQISPRALPFTLAASDRPAFDLVVSGDAEPRLVGARMSRTEISLGGGVPGITVRGRGPAPMPPPGGANAPIAPGAISGIVVDAAGAPIAGIPVQALRRQSGAPAATAQLLPMGRSVVTDAEGRYRIQNLAAGSYFVVAHGLKGDLMQPTVPPSRSVPPAASADGRRRGVVTTFFPDATVSANARQLVVGAEELGGIDLRLRVAELVEVTGRVVPSTGSAFRGGLAYLRPEPVPEQISGNNVMRTTVAPDGRFTFSDVPVGHYTLAYIGGDGWLREDFVASPAAPAGVAVPLESPLRPFFTVSGIIELDVTRERGGAEAFSGMTVSLNASPLVSGSTQPRAQVSPTGEFTIARVAGGRYTLAVTSATPWTAISASINGQDTLDTPADVSTDVTRAVIKLADRDTAVRGTVKDSGGQVAASGSVVVFSQDPAHWIPVASRRVRVTTLLPGGSFVLTSLPPGQYYLAAVVTGTTINNTLLRAIAGQATPVELGIGDKKTIDLVLIVR